MSNQADLISQPKTSREVPWNIPTVIYANENRRNIILS